MGLAHKRLKDVKKKYNHICVINHSQVSLLLSELKDSHYEKVPSNKTALLAISMNVDIWVVDTSNLHFIRDCYTKAKLSKKKKISYWQTPFL